MAFRKRRVRRKRRFVKRRRTSRAMVPRRRFVPAEVKRHTLHEDVAITFHNGVNNIRFNLGNIAQGVGASQRIGLKIAPVALRVRTTVFATVPVTVRVAVIRYHEDESKCTFDPLEIWSARAAPPGVIEPNSPRNWLYKKSYSILKQRVITIQPQVSGAITNKFLTMTLKPMKNILYVGSGAGAGNNGKEGLWLFYQSNITSPSPSASMTMSARLYFKDP